MPLLEAIDAGDTDAVWELLRSMSAEERLTYGERVQNKCAKLHDGSWNNKPKRHVVYSQGTDDARIASAIALFACSGEEIEYPRYRANYDWQAIVWEVATKFRPPWTASPEAHACFGLLMHFSLRYHFDDYQLTDDDVEAIIGTGFRNDEPLVDSVRKARFVETGYLYELFRIEGGQQTSLAAADKYRREENQWGYVFTTLAENGELNRQRLLDLALDALAADYAAFRAGWFRKFYDGLKPSEQEKKDRANALLALTESTIPQTVAFASKEVAALHKQGAIDNEALLAKMPSLFAATQKTVVKRAVTLLKTILKTEVERRTEALVVAASGLIHAAIDVQSACLELINHHWPTLSDEARAAVADELTNYADLIAPSLREQLPISVDTQPQIVHQPARNAEPFAAEYLLALPQNDNEAIEAVAAALEAPYDAIAFELALYAMSAFPKLPNNDAAKALLKRAKARWKSTSRFERILQNGLVVGIIAWFAGETCDWLAVPERMRGWRRPLYEQELITRQRMDALIERIHAQQIAPILSTPSQVAGAITLTDFCTRLQAWRDSGLSLEPFDAVLALQRLAPSDRVEASKLLNKEETKYLRAAEPVDTGDVSVHVRHSDSYTFYSIICDGLASGPKVQTKYILRQRFLEKEFCRTSGMARWIASTQPWEPAMTFRCGAVAAGGWDFNETRGSNPWLEAARWPWVQLGVAGAWNLLMALASRQTKSIELAIEVGQLAIAESRIDSQSLATVLATLLTSGMLKAKRLTANLAELSAYSTDHAQVVASAIGQGLRSDPEASPRDVAALLELYLELLITTGQSLDEGARTWLESSRRGGKVAKAKKALLAL